MHSWTKKPKYNENKKGIICLANPQAEMGEANFMVSWSHGMLSSWSKYKRSNMFKLNNPTVYKDENSHFLYTSTKIELCDVITGFHDVRSSWKKKIVNICIRIIF